MMDVYVTGCINQLESRIRELRARIPRRLPRDYDTLAKECRSRLDASLATLRSLRGDPDYQVPANQPERMRKLKREVADLDMLETEGIAALVRATDDDHQLNRLLERITQEIDYPLVTPVVTTLSQQYFCINTELNLLAVPLIEGRFLLHLPDLYHELAHPLLLARDEPQVEAFLAAFGLALRDVLAYLEDESVKESRRNGPLGSETELGLWRLCWVRFWLTEFFCDLFAVCTLGPAFVWSHLHLCALRGKDPFDVAQHYPSSHPADDARMKAMLAALSACGFNDEATVISSRWTSLATASGFRPEPEYHRCFPVSVLNALASHAKNGVEQMRCRLALKGSLDGPVRLTLNSAWAEFWADPNCYAQWEQQAVRELMQEDSSRIGAPTQPKATVVT
ncbi:MAG: hypothetical protein M5U20_05890 [Phycisphaerales bacterium]|nr:hypothetical protein [Phycisphaerales bacterium]